MVGQATKMKSPPAEEDRIEQAKEAILQLYREGLQVAYYRELRHRLETRFPHDDIGNAIKELVDERKLKRTDVPGKRGASSEHPNVFLILPTASYKRILPTMRKNWIYLSSYQALAEKWEDMLNWLGGMLLNETIGLYTHLI